MSHRPPGTDQDLRARPRLLFLDWLRIAAVIVLVFYHVGMYYVRWPFHVKSPHAPWLGPLVEPWMKLPEPWRMSLLFFISGAVTSLMLRQSGAPPDGTAATGRWLRRRSRRLLVPLLFGVVVLIPPQSYFEVVQQYGYAGRFGDFLGLYFTHFTGFCRPAAGADSTRCLILPTYNHLWFLPYVWLYTVLLWLGLRRWPHLLDTAGAWVDRRLGAPALLLLPPAWLATIRWALHDRSAHQGSLLNDGYHHLLFVSLFLAGAVFVRSRQLGARIEALRGFTLAMALAAGAWYASGHGRDLTVACLQWGALAAAVGFASQHWNVDHPWRRTLNDAVFPVYLLHQTCIIVLAQWLAPLDWSPALEASALVGGTVLLSGLIYAGARRVPGLRLCLGIAPPPGGLVAQAKRAPSAPDQP